MNPERRRIDEQIAQAERDLVEVDEQVRLGELDEETAGRLRTAYREEIAGLRRRLERLDRVPPVPRRARSRRRLLAGALVLGVGIVVIVVTAVLSVRNRPQNVLAGVADAVVQGEGVDLSQVSNEEMEQVVAANPDVLGMRLALARRYFEAGEFDKALEHYMVILEKGPQPEALANVGWMTYLSGRPDIAATFEERALELEPDYLPAAWFLANIRLEGLDDPQGAVAPLERLLAAKDLPADIRAAAEEMLATARGSS